MSVISGLAKSIFQTEFDGNTGIMPESYVYAWLGANLGKLNALIHTQFSGVDAELDLEAQAIYKELYMGHFYKKQSSAAVRGVVSSEGGDILSMRDAHSSITFANRNEISKSYKYLSDESFNTAKELAHKYTIYQAQPRQVLGL
jgi:hypothetical protein